MGTPSPKRCISLQRVAYGFPIPQKMYVTTTGGILSHYTTIGIAASIPGGEVSPHTTIGYHPKVLLTTLRIPIAPQASYRVKFGFSLVWPIVWPCDSPVFLSYLLYGKNFSQNGIVLIVENRYSARAVWVLLVHPTGENYDDCTKHRSQRKRHISFLCLARRLSAFLPNGGLWGFVSQLCE